MIYLQVFWVFFITNILGYGGGPSTIPLFQAEVVEHYKWLTLKEFGDVLAIANALPGPIATKMSSYIGYQVAGPLGSILALIATVLPTAVAMVFLFKFVTLFKSSPYVKELTKSVQPVVAVLLLVLAYQFLVAAWESSGWIHTAILALGSFWAMERIKVHPALVIGGSLVYGAVFLS
ncbi:chromate transporter [Ammoniphilus resinae]|uniref:Chromate transporter n=1 Tax=Ammoniphilus resinae TaxID=861532 RepID=A0ABS4GK05_9BACL|nr:chromate transporter [Ammoniphilus resinae]MBP1930250.1 chromate transporter [Ammoniphilus resinae]